MRFGAAGPTEAPTPGRRIRRRRLSVGALALALATAAAANFLLSEEPSASLPAPRTSPRATAAAGVPRSSPRKAPRRSPRKRPSAALPMASARRALRALDRSFGAGHGLFDKYADGPAYAGAWAVAQAMEGAIGLAKLPDGGVGPGRIATFFDGLQRYWDGSGATPGYDKALKPPLGPGGFKFYDDNALIGLALIRGYEVTQDPAMLARARRVFAFETHGWDRRQTDAHPGGIFWTQAPGSPARNTVSTAGAAELGLHLYLLTGDRGDLAWATRMYDWINATLRAPDGLYWDRVYPNGAIKKRQWSYNQGLMLGANELLYRATGDRSYLQQAVRIGDRAVSYYRHRRGFHTQRPILNGIFFQNLLALDQLKPNPVYLRAARRYARYLGRHLNPRTGVLQVTPRPELLDQAALVQVNTYIAVNERGIPVG